MQFHKDLLNDDGFVSPDESLNKTAETEGRQTQTDTDSKNEKPTKKGKAKRKQKKRAKKEEQKLNETFSMDEEEVGEAKPKIPEPKVEKPVKRGKRKQKDCTLEPSTASEPEAADSVIEKNMTDVSSVVESEPERKTQEPPGKKTKKRARKASSKDEKKVEEPVLQVPNDEPLKERKRRVRKASKKEDDKKEEPVVEAKSPPKETVAQKRGRSSRGSVQNTSIESNIEQEQVKPPVKRLKKSSSFTIIPSVTKPETPVVSKTEEKKKTPLPAAAAQPSRLPRKSIFTTPAKVLATPASTKKQALPSTSIPKPKAKAAPNFAELHQKQFNKMQSVDEYVEKKKARTEAVKTPAKALVSNITNTTATSKPLTPKGMKFNFVSGKIDTKVYCKMIITHNFTR